MRQHVRSRGRLETRKVWTHMSTVRTTVLSPGPTVDPHELYSAATGKGGRLSVSFRDGRGESEERATHVVPDLELLHGHVREVRDAAQDKRRRRVGRVALVGVRLAGEQGGSKNSRQLESCASARPEGATYLDDDAAAEHRLVQVLQGRRKISHGQHRPGQGAQATEESNVVLLRVVGVHAWLGERRGARQDSLLAGDQSRQGERATHRDPCLR